MSILGISAWHGAPAAGIVVDGTLVVGKVFLRKNA